MSFILEALRKLEEKRVPETTREILIGRSRVVLSGSRKSIWPWVLCGALLFNGAILLFWLMSGSQEQRPQAETAVWLPAPFLGPLPQTMRDPSPAPPAKREDAVNETIAETAPAPDENPAAAAAIEEILGGETAEAVAPAAAVPVEAAFAEGGPEEDRIYRIEELPAEIGGGIADLRIVAHVYSDEASLRLVSIGDGLRREGESLKPGLTLEEITPEGAILTYRGYRLLLKGY